MKRRIGWLVLPVLVLVLAPFSGVRAQQPDDPSAPGPWPVGYREIVLTDTSRDVIIGGRSLPVHIWYPAVAEEASDAAVYIEGGYLQLPALIARVAPPVAPDERWPLILFSHGFGGTPLQSTPLMEVLASHGFVVASVEHLGNSQGSAPVPRDQAEADRVPDISFVIDQLLLSAQDRESPWFRALHPFRIGVTGHSYGGSTSMGLAVGEFGVVNGDPRVKAILPVAGDMSYFSDQALAGLQLPLLMLNGSLDTSVPLANSARAYDLSPAGQPAWRVDIAGATHTHFANICSIADALIALGIEEAAWPGIGAGELVQPWRDTCTAQAYPIAEAQRLQNLYTVAFFKLHIQRDNRYMRYLKPAYNQQREAAITLWRKAGLPWVAENKVW